MIPIPDPLTLLSWAFVVFMPFAPAFWLFISLAAAVMAASVVAGLYLFD